MTNHRITDHGLPAFVEEVFAFESPRTDEVTKPAEIAPPNAEPVAKTAPATAKPAVGTSQIDAQKTTPVATARSNSQDSALVTYEVRSPSQEVTAAATSTQLATSKVKFRAATRQPVEPKATTASKSQEVAAQILSNSAAPPVSPPALPRKESKTAAELAGMIELELMQSPGSPAKGLRVTVYGGTSNWRAMLTIAPAAGAVRNAQYLRDMTDNFAERLRQEYDLAWQ